MSGYGYVGTSGYADDVGKPGSMVWYNVGRGTRAYVTRIEERVEQVRRPSVMGYTYSSAGKAEKEGRPREVDDFITKILDEVNGPSVSTTRRVDSSSDDGVGYKYIVDSPTKVGGGRSYSEVEHMYIGSPAGSQISRKYADRYDRQGLPSYVYDHPPQTDYGVPNKATHNSHVTTKTSRDYGVSKNQWERSSHPNFDASPYNPPPVDSYPSIGYDVKPTSPTDNGVLNYQWGKHSHSFYDHPPKRDYGAPNNVSDNSRLKSEMPKDYDVPRNQRERPLRPIYDASPYNPSPVESYASQRYEVKPDSPRDNGDLNSRWDKRPSTMSDQPPQRDYSVPNNRPTNSSINMQSPKSYEGSGKQWGKPSNHIYDQTQSNNNDDNSPIKAQTSEGYGDRDNQWGRPLKPVSTPRSNYVDVQQGNSPLKASSSDGHGIPDNLNNRSSIPEYDHPSRNELVGGFPNNRWGNFPVKPMFGQTAPIDDTGATDRQGSNSSLKPQPPNRYGDSESHVSRSSSPNYAPPSQTKALGGGLKNWSNSPLKPTSDQAAQNDNNGEQIYSSMNPQSPKGYGGRDSQWRRPSSPVYSHSPQNGNKEQNNDQSKMGNKYDGSPDSRRINSPLNPESPKGYEVSNEKTGRSASPEYEHPPRYEIIAPPKVQVPQDNEGRSNTPVKTQSPRDNQWGSPSSPLSNRQKLEPPNVAVRPDVSGFSNKPLVTNNNNGHEPRGNNSYPQSKKPLGHSYE